MKLNKKIEEEIKKEALKLLKHGRTNWDIKHTLTVVKWMKQLIDKENGNAKVLIPAAYLHDTGYEELRKGYNHKELMKAKKGHAEMGAENAKKFLPGLNYFSEEEIKEIIYLIANHDKHDNIKEKNRQLLFEADGLGQIDWTDCSPSFDKKNCIEFLNTYYAKRKKFIKTKLGKEMTKKMMRNVNTYLDNWQE